MEDNKNTQGYNGNPLDNEDNATNLNDETTALSTEKGDKKPIAEKDEELTSTQPADTSAEESIELEEAPASESEPQEADAESNKKEEKKKKRISFSPSKVEAMSYSEVVDAVGLLLQQDELPKEKDIDILESAFVKKKEALEADDSKAEEFEDAKIQALRLNDLIGDYRVRYREYQEEQARKEEEALATKKEIVKRLEQLLSSTEEFGTLIRKFREIETEWNESGRFAGDSFKELQDQYSSFRDDFYDLKQLNDDFRDIDFKKNLEAKEELIARAEELATAPNPAAANREIGDLHARWKEIGPVAKDLRDEIWERFAVASKKVRNRGQEFFNNRKEEEEKNLEQKKKICEAVEDIAYDKLKNARDWNNKKNEVIQKQQEWKEVGAVPRSESNAIYKRFRAACDVFFSKRALALKDIFEEQEENYRAKLALVEEAESLADSTDWSKTAERLKDLQKEWNGIGFPGAKHRNLWPRFRSACDAFFNARKEQFKERRQEVDEILDKKKEYIAKAEEMLQQEVSDVPEERHTFSDTLFQLIEDFKGAGRLPMRQTQKIHNKFYNTTNQIFKKWKLDQTSRRLENYSEKVDQLVADGDKEKLRDEITYYTRRKERLTEELTTSQNSIQLITSSSNWGDSMLRDIEKKNKALERDLKLIDEKLSLLRETLAKLRDEK